MILSRRKAAVTIAAVALTLVGAPAAMARTAVHVDVPGSAGVDVVVDDDAPQEVVEEPTPPLIEERVDESHSESHTVRTFAYPGRR